MRKFFAGLVSLMITMSIISCQKEPSDELPAATTGDRVKTYTEDVTQDGWPHTVDSFVISYDASNRIVSMVAVAGTDGKFVYSYPSANTIVREIYSGSELQIHSEDYYVDNHIDSSFQYNNEGDSSTAKFIYNVAGQWSKQYEYDYSKATGSVLFLTTNYTFDGNANQVKEEDSDGNSTSFDFYTDKKYYHPLIGPGYIPLAKLYLIKTITAVSGGTTEIGNVTYTFDDKDRMSTETTVTDQGSVIIKRYTYY